MPREKRLGTRAGYKARESDLSRPAMQPVSVEIVNQNRQLAKSKPARLKPDLKEAVMEAFYASTEETDGGIEWLIEMRDKDPYLFVPLLAKAMPTNRELLEVYTTGPLHFLETVMKNNDVPLDYRVRASKSMLDDRTRIQAVCMLKVLEVTGQLKTQIGSLPANEVNMKAFLERFEGYFKFMLEESMKTLQLPPGETYDGK